MSLQCVPFPQVAESVSLSVESGLGCMTLLDKWDTSKSDKEEALALGNSGSACEQACSCHTEDERDYKKRSSGHTLGPAFHLRALDI